MIQKDGLLMEKVKELVSNWDGESSNKEVFPYYELYEAL